MNKRQRKKQFKKIHGMNPRDYFMKGENAPNAVIFLLIRVNDQTVMQNGWQNLGNL